MFNFFAVVGQFILGFGLTLALHDIVPDSPMHVVAISGFATSFLIFLTLTEGHLALLRLLSRWKIRRARCRHQRRGRRRKKRLSRQELIS